jgi:hypothetical protein
MKILSSVEEKYMQFEKENRIEQWIYVVVLGLLAFCLLLVFREL